MGIMRKRQRIELIFGDAFYSENYMTITLDEKQSKILVKLIRKAGDEGCEVQFPDYEDED